MTERDPEALDFDELEPLPEEAELAELPHDVHEVDALEALPEEAVLEELPVEPEPAPKPAPAKAPAAAAATPAPKAQPTAEQPHHAEHHLAEDVEKAAAAAALPVAAHAAAKPAGPAAAAAPAKPVVAAGGGSRRERTERDKEARETKPKSKGWERWPGPGEKPKREMEQAPTILRKAALGLMIGCLLPWGGITEAWIGSFGEKLLVIAGLYVWHQAHLLRDGVKVPGAIASLGKSSFLPLFVTAGLLTLVGFLPVLSWATTFEDLAANAGPFAEKGFLILAGLTWTHIYDYQHGGKFNPMFPLMFLAPAIAGVMALLKVFSAESIGIGQILGGLGAILVGFAGSMAAYTMYVALKEAKAHGEAKRAAQAEARKAARADRRGE